MNICLVFPPISDPRGPHLAPAALAAVLRRNGHAVIVRDVDLETVLSLLSPASLDRHVQIAKELLSSLDIYGPGADWKTLAWRQKISQSLDAAEPIISQIPGHIDALSSESFYNPSRYFAGRRAVDAALALIACTYDYELTYRMDGQVFSSRYKADQLADLLQAVSDDRTNLFCALYDQAIVPEILDQSPELVAISILNYQQIIPGLTLASKLKQAGLFVVIGGTVYTKFVESLARSPDFFRLCDAVVVYEGESAMLGLAAALARNRACPDLSSVPNLLWYDGRSVKVNQPFHAEDIASLPTPDFSGFPLDRYLAPSLVLPYNLGKGCYWNQCLFCEIPLIHNLPGNTCRVKPARLIVDQLQELSDRFQTRYFQFTDESCSPMLLEEIADEIIARGLRIYYLCYARLEAQFTIERLRKMKAGGLRKLMFGLESGSDRMLQKMNKGITAGQARAVLDNCGQAGVHFRLFVILGQPGETLEEAWETRMFLREISPLLRDPNNSFEINLFHLDSFSAYGRNPAQYNISLHRHQAGDFFLGSDRFACPEGMDRKTLHGFISEMRTEMYELTDMASKHSGWEEYSLLTICRQEGDA